MSRNLMWYHGDTAERNDFTNQVWDRDRRYLDANSYGPGLYFTSDLNIAKNYGPFVYETSIPNEFNLIPDKKLDLNKLLEFYRLANDLDKTIFLNNYDTFEPRKALENYKRNNAFNSLLSLYQDLIRSPNEWIYAIRKFGFDGVIINDKSIKHFIIYSPEKLKIKRL